MIRRATHNDCDAIMSIVRSAQQALAELGIDQWQDGYPEREVVVADVESGVGYVACDDSGSPLGYAAIVLNGEPAYRQIASSNWHTPDDYVVVHRLCVAQCVHRQGVALKLMRYAADIAVQNDIHAMRIDTHEGNVRMLTMLAKIGFEYVGKIVYENSGERVVYDKEFSLDNKL